MADPNGRNAIRLSTAEREAVSKRLEEHLIAGRLEPQEFSDRLEAVQLAIHRNDLDALFEDLPRSSGVMAAGDLPRLRVRRRPPLRSMLTWMVGALSPFLALWCFFDVRQTPAWFLLVPAAIAIAQLADRRRGLPPVQRRRRY